MKYCVGHGKQLFKISKFKVECRSHVPVAAAYTSVSYMAISTVFQQLVCHSLIIYSMGTVIGTSIVLYFLH